MDKYLEIANRIKNANVIGIVTHINPDGDAIGSALALWRVLSIYGKKCDCLCDGVLPDEYKEVPLNVFFGKKNYTNYDLVISVDVSDLSRCGIYQELFKKHKSISIDHHQGRGSFSNFDLVELTSSNSEILYKLFVNHFKEQLTKDVAELLYIGLITDCGGFAYEYVNSNSFKVASELLKYGLDNSALYRKYLSERSLGQVKMSAYVISKAIYECGGHLAFLIFNQEILDKFDCDINKTSIILNDILRAKDIWVAISLTEVAKNSYKVSIRSKGNLVSALDIANEFGGGGHKNASGCRINGDIGIVLDKLTYAVSKNM